MEAVLVVALVSTALAQQVYWGFGHGWCSSDFDVFASNNSNINECWDNSVNKYGVKRIVAV